MRNLALIGIGSLFCIGSLHAEPRTFTDKNGRKVEAEVVAVEDKVAVLKLANASKAKVPLDLLSESDQEFVKSWWEKNKDKVTEMDMTLSIDKSTKRIRNPDSGKAAKEKEKKAKKKSSKDEVQYSCTLESFARRDISGITVAYTIYKRVSTRDEKGTETTTEEIEGSTTIANLESHGTTTFDTGKVVCEDISQKGGKDKSISKRETVIGFVVTLSANGEEFLKQSHPENFIDRLEEEAQREKRFKTDP